MVLLSTKDERLMKLDSLEEVFLYKAFIEPVLNNKIIIMLIEGKSGEGKSMTSLSLAEHLEYIFHKITNKNSGVFDPEKQVVYTPSEYAEKIQEWTKRKYLTFVVDELRFLVPKEKWSSLLNQSIAEANATLRAIKIHNVGYPGVIIYNTQSLSDITKSIRKTITYDVRLTRGNGKVVGVLYQFWEDLKNVEKPVLRLKKFSFDISGYTFKIRQFEIKMPSLNVRHYFMKHSAEAKARILELRRRKIIKEIEKDLGQVKINWKEELKNDEIFNLLKSMASYSEKRGVYFSKVNMMAITKMYDLTTKEFKKEFLPMFKEEVKRRGLI